MRRSASGSRVSDQFSQAKPSHSRSMSRSQSVRLVEDAELHLPRYDPSSQSGKREEKSRSRSAENVVHFIPLLLVLCVIILWLFSRSGVEVEEAKGCYLFPLGKNQLFTARTGATQIKHQFLLILDFRVQTNIDSVLKTIMAEVKRPGFFFFSHNIITSTSFSHQGLNPSLKSSFASVKSSWMRVTSTSIVVYGLLFLYSPVYFYQLSSKKDTVKEGAALMKGRRITGLALAGVLVFLSSFIGHGMEKLAKETGLHSFGNIDVDMYVLLWQSFTLIRLVHLPLSQSWSRAGERIYIDIGLQYFLIKILTKFSLAPKISDRFCILYIIFTVGCPQFRALAGTLTNF
ncbi:hypothetical protein YC2023_094968 [Brassica napus]